MSHGIVGTSKLSFFLFTYSSSSIVKTCTPSPLPPYCRMSPRSLAYTNKSTVSSKKRF